jgi:hypothetical protein
MGGAMIFVLLLSSGYLKGIFTIGRILFYNRYSKLRQTCRLRGFTLHFLCELNSLLFSFCTARDRPGNSHTTVSGKCIENPKILANGSTNLIWKQYPCASPSTASIVTFFFPYKMVPS